jgi:hypothetical protein
MAVDFAIICSLVRPGREMRDYIRPGSLSCGI